MKLIVDLIYEGGMAKMRKSISVRLNTVTICPGKRSCGKSREAIERFWTIFRTARLQKVSYLKENNSGGRAQF